MAILTDDLQVIREGVRALCETFGDAYWRTVEKERNYPTEFVAALTAEGYLSALIPREYGGSGRGIAVAGAILQEICQSGGHPGICHAQMYTMGTLLRHGNAAQKAAYLPKIAAGSLRLQVFGVTEPNAGTDTTRIETFAKREGDEYVITGRKRWISRVAHSDLMLLLTRTTPREGAAKKTAGMTVFLIELDKAIGHGLTIEPIDSWLNRHSTNLIFDGLRVSAENIIGEVGNGFRCILDGMNAERILLAHEAIGDAYWFIEKARTYATEREVFGRPIGQNQAVQFPIAKCYAQAKAAELLVKEAAAKFDVGEKAGAEANMAFYLAGEVVWEAADVCMQTFGGNGFATNYDIERKYREARLYRIAPLSTNLLLSYIGEHVLGMPRSF